MILRVILFVILSLFMRADCTAQTESQYPADIEYKKCIAKDTSCANISDCTFIVFNIWDREMKTAYSKLQKTLKNEKDKVALVQSQAAWESYRDATFRSFDNMFNQPGSKWCRIRHEYRVDVVRTRTLQLRKYLADLRKK